MLNGDPETEESRISVCLYLKEKDDRVVAALVKNDRTKRTISLKIFLIRLENSTLFELHNKGNYGTINQNADK